MLSDGGHDLVPTSEKEALDELRRLDRTFQPERELRPSSACQCVVAG